MKGKSVMLQGTSSSVGKSILATALCRIFTQDGYHVNPFKSQNMSLNSAITPEGHEMGRAQVMQAEAAHQVPSSRMNPILLKPTTDHQSQVIFNGIVYADMDAVEYFKFKPQLREKIKAIYRSLADESDIVVIEGAGSPAEINLKEDDIVNMGMAEMADSPVILIGDIDRGGVFASLVGTMMLLTEEERCRVKGVIINKFRGSLEILKPGLQMLEELIHVPVLGVIPHFNLDLEDEDSVTDWEKYTRNEQGDLDVAVIKLPHISNFTDFNALSLQRDVRLRFVELTDPLGEPDLIILPGTKSTMDDCLKLYQTGMAEQILSAHQNNSCVFGICGGYQMLGKRILDPMQVEASQEVLDGLGLLDVVTTFSHEKTTTLSEGIEDWFGKKVQGYEIHMGDTALGKNSMPFIKVIPKDNGALQGMDGAMNLNKTAAGTYFHGIFDNAFFTGNYLDNVREIRKKEPIKRTGVDYWQYKEEQYDQLADIVREHLDMKKIYEIMEDRLDG